jgi:hypothetical protein
VRLLMLADIDTLFDKYRRERVEVCYHLNEFLACCDICAEYDLNLSN